MNNPLMNSLTAIARTSQYTCCGYLWKDFPDLHIHRIFDHQPSYKRPTPEIMARAEEDMQIIGEEMAKIQMELQGFQFPNGGR